MGVPSFRGGDWVLYEVGVGMACSGGKLSKVPLPPPTTHQALPQPITHIQIHKSIAQSDEQGTRLEGAWGAILRPQAPRRPPPTTLAALRWTLRWPTQSRLLATTHLVGIEEEDGGEYEGRASR